MQERIINSTYSSNAFQNNVNYADYNEDSTNNETSDTQNLNNFTNTDNPDQQHTSGSNVIYNSKDITNYSNYLETNIPRTNYQDLFPCYSESLTTCFSEQPYLEHHYNENYDNQSLTQVYNAYDVYNNNNYNYNYLNNDYSDTYALAYNKPIGCYGYESQIKNIYAQALPYTITANTENIAGNPNGIAECSTRSNSCNSSVVEQFPDKVDYPNEVMNNQLYQYNQTSSGISGVKFQPSDNRWIARWTTSDGKRACKSFSVNIYGFEQAKSLAINARHKGVLQSGRSFCNRERQHAMRSGVGIIGIRFDKTQARWVSSYYEGGKRKFRYFTVKDFGYEQAKQRAILWKTCNDERLIQSRRSNQANN